MSLPRQPASATEARHQLARFATEQGVRAADLVLLVTSELVTNAINYGAGPIDVRITYIDGVVRIEVSDSDPDTARVVPRTRTAERPGGHGLHIVAALTNRWGTAARAGGKTVWAELDSV